MASARLSVRRTSNPASAAAYAMPCPIVPAPTTATGPALMPPARPPPGVRPRAGWYRSRPPEVEQLPHCGYVVDGPDNELHARPVQRCHQRTIDERVLLPQDGGACVPQRPERLDGIGRAQHAQPQTRSRGAEALDNTVVERVHGVAGRIGAVAQDVE